MEESLLKDWENEGEGYVKFFVGGHVDLASK
jgi:hypothetical protein